GAFFHNAAHADGNVRVLDHLKQVPFVVRTMAQGPPVEVLAKAALIIIEIIKATDLVRAVIGAITGADATVIDHEVETFLIVHRGIDGTNIFTGSGLAM